MQEPAQPPVSGKIMCGVHRFVILAQELGAFSFWQVGSSREGTMVSWDQLAALPAAARRPSLPPR